MKLEENGVLVEPDISHKPLLMLLQQFVTDLQLENGDQIREAGRETTQSQPVARSASTMESELLGYKRKVEQMTVLLSHYQSELESQKVRRDGVETVSRLLAECRQENLALKKSHAALEMTVKNLHNRLAVNGISPKSTMNDNEVIVPGTSKQTLTNLAMENKRLRSMLQESVSSETCESVQKTVEVCMILYLLFVCVLCVFFFFFFFFFFFIS